MLIESTELSEIIGNSDETLLIDITTAESYAKHHIPAAVFFEFKKLISGIAPAPGKLPEISNLSQELAAAGINKEKTIIAYDDEGGGKASRLLWTLDILGFEKLHLINGGLHAWAQAGLGLEATPHFADTVAIEDLEFDQNKIADKEFILANLNNSEVVIWDVRTEEEYTGTKPRATRNGHIPGAVNLNWMDTIDRQNGLRYLPKEQLTSLLESKGLTQDKTIVPHCQTHHRSAHSSILLKCLGYQNVRAYPGSWSEWGNAEDTPVET